jgi:hypothetical protein
VEGPGPGLARVIAAVLAAMADVGVPAAAAAADDDCFALGLALAMIPPPILLPGEASAGTEVPGTEPVAGDCRANAAADEDDDEEAPLGMAPAPLPVLPAAAASSSAEKWK